MTDVSSEAGYVRQNRDVAVVALNDAIERVEQTLTAIKHGIPIDTRINHNDSFAVIESEMQTIRLAADDLAQ